MVTKPLFRKTKEFPSNSLSSLLENIYSHRATGTRHTDSGSNSIYNKDGYLYPRSQTQSKDGMIKWVDGYEVGVEAVKHENGGHAIMIHNLRPRERENQTV